MTVVFGPLKQDFGQKRNALLHETGQHVSKENFLLVYGQAHIQTITPELVREAFHKTSIVPVDCTVVTLQMLAPSKDSSHQVISPIIPPTLVCKVTEYLLDVLPLGSVQESPTTPSHTHATEHNPAIAFWTRAVASELKETSAAFLFHDSPIKSSTEPPDLATLTISQPKGKKDGNKDYISSLLAKKPKHILSSNYTKL